MQNSNKAKEVERSINKRFHKGIWSRFTAAINDYELIQEGRQNCRMYFRRQGFYAYGKAFSGAEKA